MEEAMLVLKEGEVWIQAAYVKQQQVDGYEAILGHAKKRKAVFDQKVKGGKPGEVVFLKGDLVQIQ